MVFAGLLYYMLQHHDPSVEGATLQNCVQLRFDHRRSPEPRRLHLHPGAGAMATPRSAAGVAAISIYSAALATETAHLHPGAGEHQIN
jgi:hypothetical protein